MATLITKNSSTASSVPTAAQLVQGELAVNVTDKRLFTENASGTVVELGTNPSTLALPNGSANGVAYLNGSKILTTGSALAFDGTNLGVGTASPSYKFEVNSVISSVNGSVRGLFYSDSSKLILDTTGSAPISFQLTGSEGMRLTSTGLGIGTSSPGSFYLENESLLTVGTGSGNGGITIYTGSTSQGGIFFADGTSGAATYSGILRYNHSANAMLFYTNGLNERMRLDSSGNLGLGVTPSAWGSTRALQVNRVAVASIGGTGKFATNWYNDGTDRYLTTDFASLYQQNDGQHRFYTAPSGTAGNAITFTQAMTLDASGNLLVGATGTAYSNTDSVLVEPTTGGGQVVIQHKSGSSSGASYCDFIYNAGRIGNISQNGTTAVAYNTSSDYRLKNIDGPLTGSGEFIDALKPKVGTWKADGSKFVGFLAHEVQEVSPGTVVGEKDAVDEEGKPIMQAMEYGSAEFIANIIAELQSLRARVSALEAK